MIKLNKVLLLFLLLTFISRVNPGQSLDEVDFNKTINVSFAAGLNSSVNQIISEFKKIHPKAKFIRESGRHPAFNKEDYRA